MSWGWFTRKNEKAGGTTDVQNIDIYIYISLRGGGSPKHHNMHPLMAHPAIHVSAGAPAPLLRSALSFYSFAMSSP